MIGRIINASYNNYEFPHQLVTIQVSLALEVSSCADLQGQVVSFLVR